MLQDFPGWMCCPTGPVLCRSRLDHTQPFMGAVDPQSLDIAESIFHTFYVHLMEAFTLNRELHPPHIQIVFLFFCRLLLSLLPAFITPFLACFPTIIHPDLF